MHTKANFVLNEKHTVIPLSCNIINTSMMHIPSQALIAMGEEEDKTVLRRYNQTSNLPLLNQKHQGKTTRKRSLQSIKVFSFCGFPDINGVHGNKDVIAYDTEAKTLGTQVINHDVKQTVNYLEETDVQSIKQTVKSTDSQRSTINTYVNQEYQQTRVENVGFRRQNIAGDLTKNITSSTPTALLRDAKYEPSSSGTNNRQRNRMYDDVPLSSTNKNKSLKAKPKSLIDQLKESISYGSRLVPSMQMRKVLPPPSPNSIVFSMRKNDKYSHKDIKDLIENETGFKARSIQYDPVNVRAGSSEVTSRWIVQFGCLYETYNILQKGMEINGEKIVVRKLDDIYKLELAAYKMKMEEERKQKEKANIVCVPKKCAIKRTQSTIEKSVHVNL